MVCGWLGKVARGVVGLTLIPVLSGVSFAQSTSTPLAQPPLTTTETVTVIGTTPLPGVDVPVEQIPAPVQTATSTDILYSGALDMSTFFNRRLNGVHVNETQGNPFQPDVNFRGYTASPLLGTPQGLSVFMDGVRLNQPFGDVVSWDLIPRIAIASTTLISGSSPVFGLNTLGGALSLQTKDGRIAPGTTVQAVYGNDARRAVEVEHGGANAARGLDWYLAGNLFAEDGWRDDSPSDVRQVFGKLGWTRDRASTTFSVSHANNALTGNGLQETRLLDRDFASIYTKPDETHNRSTLFNVVTRRDVSDRLTVAANAYLRHIRTRTLNGDINEEALDQSLYQPGAAERAALAAAGYGTVPASGLDSTNTPFPFLRCVGNVLLVDEPAEKCNGLLNRSETTQNNGGASGQVVLRGSAAERANRLTLGVAYDRSGVGFGQSTELGYLNPDHGVTGLGVFGDGVTGGDTDGEPYDVRVDLDGAVQTWSVFLADTFALGSRAFVTASGRFNRTSVENRDQINPGAGPGSLDGDHAFNRFNPAIGVTFDASPATNLYAGYSEGSRAATSIELGCADPESPCKLPNAMAGDPPLEQVVTRTLEGGVRGTRNGISWHVGAFRAANDDDILFVTSEQTGFGYFKNFGQTRRQGFELGLNRQVGRVSVGAGYTFLDATFQSEETVNGESNSANDAAEDGEPGLEGSIEIEPGNRMPLIPRHILKAFADVQVTPAFGLNVDLVAMSSVIARGNENGEHEPDGQFYMGPGEAPGYAVVNLGLRYDVTQRFQIIAQINNLFDRQYSTAAQLGPAGFRPDGTFIAREFAAIGGEFPVRQSTFFAPGAPARGSVGVRLRF